jgi:hypothetical protein
LLPTTVTDVSEVPDEQPATTVPAPAAEAVDLDAVERDLTAVEVALNRLADGTYWTDEITGQPLPQDVLARNPLARRA